MYNFGPGLHESLGNFGNKLHPIAFARPNAGRSLDSDRTVCSGVKCSRVMLNQRDPFVLILFLVWSLGQVWRICQRQRVFGIAQWLCLDGPVCTLLHDIILSSG